MSPVPEDPLRMQHEIADPVIRTEGLSRRFGAVAALRSVSVAIPPGCTGLVGPNGSGKTTFLRILTGLTRPDSGRCTVLGLDPVRDSREIRRRIGFVPEDDAYWEGLSAVGSVQYAGRLSGLSSREALKKAHALLDRAGMGEERYRHLETFSMGMRQKVRLAQALVHGPELLILDEPTRFLDPSARREFSDWARDLAREGMSILISTHELDDIERLCTRVVLLMSGESTGPHEIKAILGKARNWELQTAGSPDELSKVLNDIGINFLSNGSTFNVILESDDCTIMIKQINKRGIKIRKIERKSPPLDKILFKGAPEKEAGRA